MTYSRKILKALSTLTILAASCAFSFADYPVFYQTNISDPWGLEANGRLYIYYSYEIYKSDSDDIVNYITCISTDDMKNWTEHGPIFKSIDSKWGPRLTWAPSVVKKSNKKGDTYYLFYGNGLQAVGVAVGETPVGPFLDKNDKPIIDENTPGMAPADGRWKTWRFSPSVLLDEDGIAYVYLGGNPHEHPRVAKLKEDFSEVDGEAIQIKVPNYFESPSIHKYGDNYYFSYAGHKFGYAANIEYMTSDDPMEGFKNPSLIHRSPAKHDIQNNLHSIFKYQDKWYIAYHNRLAPEGVAEEIKAEEQAKADAIAAGKEPPRKPERMRNYMVSDPGAAISTSKINKAAYRAATLNNPRTTKYALTEEELKEIEERTLVVAEKIAERMEYEDTIRSICIEPLTHNEDGTIAEVVESQNNLPQLKWVNPYTKNEAEMMEEGYGIKSEAKGQGNCVLSDIHNNDYIKIRGVDFGKKGPDFLRANLANFSKGNSIEVRLDSLTGPLIAKLEIEDTGTPSKWDTFTTPIIIDEDYDDEDESIYKAKGVRDLYFIFKGEPGDKTMFKMDWWKFEELRYTKNYSWW